MNDEKETRFESFNELNKTILERVKCDVFHSEQEMREISCLYLNHIAGSLAILADHAPLILTCLQKEEV